MKIMLRLRLEAPLLGLPGQIVFQERHLALLFDLLGVGLQPVEGSLLRLTHLAKVLCWVFHARPHYSGSWPGTRRSPSRAVMSADARRSYWARTNWFVRLQRCANLSASGPLKTSANLMLSPPTTSIRCFAKR